MRLIVRIIITAFAVWVTTLLPLEVVVEGGDGETWQRVGVFLLVGAVVTLLSVIVKPIVNVLTLPIRILTLGLFSIVIAWFMLWLTAWVTTLLPWATLELQGGFWKTVLAALVIAVVTGVLSFVLPVSRKR